MFKIHKLYTEVICMTLGIHFFIWNIFKNRKFSKSKQKDWRHKGSVLLVWKNTDLKAVSTATCIFFLGTSWNHLPRGQLYHVGRPISTNGEIPTPLIPKFYPALRWTSYAQAHNYFLSGPDVIAALSPKPTAMKGLPMGHFPSLLHPSFVSNPTFLYSKDISASPYSISEAKSVKKNVCGKAIS